MAPPKIAPSSPSSEYEHAQSISEHRQLEAETHAAKMQEQEEFWNEVNADSQMKVDAEDEEDEIEHEDTQPTPSPPAQDLDSPEKARVNKEQQPLTSSQNLFDEKSIQNNSVRSEDAEMMLEEDASERFGTAPMHHEPDASHNHPPDSHRVTDDTNHTNTPNSNAKEKLPPPPQTPKKVHNKQTSRDVELEHPHASSVYRALLPTNMTCTLAPKLDQKGIEAENMKTSEQIQNRLEELRKEWNGLSDKFEEWADKGFEAQNRRIRCQLRAKLMDCAEKEQETHAEQEKLIQFNDSLRQVYAAYLGLGRKQMA